MNPFQRAFRLLPTSLGLAALALAILSQASVFHVQDDAYMYARYAHNLCTGNGLAWDPGGEPTYGATALFYVPWVAMIGGILPDNPGRIVVFSSVTSMLLALFAMGWLVRRLLPANDASRGLIACVSVTVLAVAHCGIAAHATNGMDTGLAMAALTLLLALWLGHARALAQGSAKPAWPWIVFASWLAFGVRPDLGLYAAGIPLVHGLLASPQERRGYFALTAVILAAIAALLAFCWWYFGTPLTLSFYAKALNTGYGAPFVQKHAPVAAQQFILFTAFYAPLWIVALIDLPQRWRGRRESENALWLGVFAATLLHWLYYRFGVMQVVGSWQRFFYPTLPALLMLGVTSGSRLYARWTWLSSTTPAGRRRVAGAFGVCTLACGGALAMPQSWTMKVLPSRLKPYREEFESAIDMLREESGRAQLLNFDMVERYANTKARNFWFALDLFSALPDEVAIATTEVGLPAAMNPKRRIIDLAGLNENGFARNGFDARRLCVDLHPDVIYLPHPDYTTQIEMLMREPSFSSDYELYPKSDLKAFMDLALWRKSPHFEELRAIVAARRAEPATSDRH